MPGAFYTWLSYRIYRKLFPPRQLLLIYGDRPTEDIQRKFASRKDKYNIVKCMNISAGADAILDEEKYPNILDGTDTTKYTEIVEKKNKIKTGNDYYPFAELATMAISIVFYLMFVNSYFKKLV